MRLLFILLFIPLNLLAQRPPIKFGAISMEELKMATYPVDSSAAAVILFDIGEYTGGGGYSKFIRHTRIKILKEDGLRFGSIGIAVSNYKTDLTRLKASTYNLVSGKIEETKVDSKGRFNEEVVDGLDFVKFAMSNVKVGSILEYKYEINYSGIIIRDWEFQNRIPCVWSEYKMEIAEWIELQLHFIGYLAPVINETKYVYCGTSQCKSNHWVMQDVPAFKEEPFISSPSNYISKVKFDLASIDMPGPGSVIFLSTWDDLGKRYKESVFFDDNVNKTGFLKKQAEELTEGLRHPDEKVQTIYNYVKKNLEWSGRNSITFFKDPKKVWEEKRGTSGEINLSLLAMLRFAGLPADPVLISTQENGFVRQEVPISTQFNRILVWSDYQGKKILLDATDRYLPMEFLPKSCLNTSGYVASEGNFRWVSLQETPKARDNVNLDLTIQENGDLKGKITASKTGYFAGNSRSKIVKDGKRKYVEEFLNGRSFTIEDTLIENIDKISEPLKESYTITLSGHTQSAGEMIYIDPMIFTKIEQNPFASESRTYPVDFEYPRETLFMLKLKIPDGYAVDEVPQSKMAILPDNSGKFVYSVTPGEGLITIMCQRMITRVLYSQDEYLALREFYNIMVAKMSEQIVLKRKT